MIKFNFNKILIFVVPIIILTIVGFFIFSNQQKKDKENEETSVENVTNEIRFIKIRGCPDEVYEDTDSIGSEITNPNYFICRSYLTDGTNVYYHGIRAIAIPSQPLAPSFIATSSSDITNSAFMGSTIIKGADPETFEIMYFDEDTLQIQQNNMLTFARDKDYLYWEGKRFEGVDPNTLVILGRGFVKDKDAVYFYWRKLEGSDGATFEFLWSGFARDKNFVYRNNPEPEIFKGVDPATFEKIDDNYLKDKNSVYYRQEKIEGSDSLTFELLSSSYAKDKNNVYMGGKRIKYADPKTFSFLIHPYQKDGYNSFSKDKNNVYFSGEIVVGADPETFEFVGNQYMKDKNTVYYNNGRNKLVGADPETFKELGWGYVKDASSVWIVSNGDEGGSVSSHRKLENADAPSFEFIDRQYAHDKAAVYCSGDVMEGFDWGSLVMLQNNYIRDKNLVFFGCDKVDGADSTSFEVISYQYSKDEISVYSLGKRIEGADPESFENLACNYSKDKNSVYKSLGQTISKLDDFDAGTFRIIGNCNPADVNGVYTNSGEKINGADADTFQFLGGSYSKDKHRAYWKAMPIAGSDTATFKFLSGEFAKDNNTTYYKGEVYDDELKAILRGTEDNIEFMINPTLPPDGHIYELNNIVPISVYPIGF